MCFYFFSPTDHPNAFVLEGTARSMSGSPVFESAWRLLKDYDFIGHLPQEYYDTLPDRMAQLMESGDTLEHVNLRPTEHYNERVRQRYNSDQALPPEFQKRGMRKYKFTLESILNFMANDLARNHPELLESMSEHKVTRSYLICLPV